MSNTTAAAAKAKPPAKKKGWRNFVAGACGGACEVIGTMPLDVIKTRMQVEQGKYANPIDCGKSIYRAGGVAGLYSGMPAFLTQTAGKGGIRFYAFEQSKKVLMGLGVDFEKNTTFGNLMCGLMAGTAEALCWTTPTERLKVLRQTEVGTSSNKYGSMIGGAMTVVREQGVKGLYVGAGPTAARQASSVGFRFMFYDTVKKAYLGVTGGKYQDAVNLLSGGTVGGLSVIVNNPLDVVKSTMQGKDCKYNSSMEAFKGILKERGAIGFAGGLTARVPRVFCGQAITFAVYERISVLIGA
uniref:Mitochondrial carrier protein n=1 Tax=Fibrocapsa japonica TaxID=94617 RepID=A0A7S2XWQ6_9STRA|mmetsp:Transcript_16760/g.24619  ORF Transcript_16760/g.24619 Transcript_16760/m.24619 type:complete len:298 (+) Transcript_16760:132-1025(+)|eukprot:CAMPEP_0113936492 /NCGR_PEP_ID=MMETSP1339-20121228/3397_1 /TAXON_ID=94617 /ORGANISM="Fibrocapsa japonica" /LENGTH=297 /DNA_ID=CAMNT_0000938993 /DNA_START=119 /DNA_END=1012 /DNA_ORIENTATION=- /assembly_acc=CAM_ASM_000762